MLQCGGSIVVLKKNPMGTQVKEISVLNEETGECFRKKVAFRMGRALKHDWEVCKMNQGAEGKKAGRGKRVS